MVRLRSIVLTGLAMLALAFANVLPSTSDIYGPGLNALGFADGAYFVSAAPQTLAVLPDDREPAVSRREEIAIVKPEKPRMPNEPISGDIALSMQTDRLSLRPGRWRT